MGLKYKKILGINITIDSEENILEEVEKYFKTASKSGIKSLQKRLLPLLIYTPNPEIITYAQKDSVFKEIVNKAQINIPDGNGVCWALSKLYGLKVNRLAGADFMLSLAKLASRKGYTIGLIGGRGNVALKTSECLQKAYPQLTAYSCDAPRLMEKKIKSGKILLEQSKDVCRKLNTKYLILNTIGKELEEKTYFKNLLKTIINRDMRMLFVAFGFPKQEYFIDRLRLEIEQSGITQPLLIMAVGGSFDYLTGKVKRAPVSWRNHGIEWLFRLLHEPRRMIRHLKGGKFFLHYIFANQ